MQWQEKLQQSNRRQYDVRIGSLDKHASEDVLRHIFGDGFDKQASFSSFDRISQTKRLIQNATGAHEEKAAEVASYVLVQANRIHEQYGGNYDAIVDQLIEKLTVKQSEINRANQAKSGVTIISWRNYSPAKLREATMDRLRYEFGIYGDDAERAVRALDKLAHSLTINYRRKKGDILQAILDIHAAQLESGTFALTDLFNPDPSRAFRDLISDRLEGGMYA